MGETGQPEQVTRLLHQWREGDQQALNALIPIVHSQMKALAARCMRAENPGHTLQTTALVNEAYLKLVQSPGPIQDRIHFFSVAAKVMRHILVDHARSNRRAKRGGGAIHVELDRAPIVGPEPLTGVEELHEGLERLASLDKVKADVVELIYFGGLTYAEVAQFLNISEATVFRHLRMAKAWLYDELNAGAGR